MQTTDLFAATLQDCVEIFMRYSISNIIRYVRETGLSMSQLGALMHIHQESCGGVGSLGDQLGVSSAAASQLLERLVQQDLVFRTEDSQDRRVKQLDLTDKGKQLLHEGLSARLGWVDELSARLSASEKEQVVASLNILIEKMLQIEPPAVSKN